MNLKNILCVFFVAFSMLLLAQPPAIKKAEVAYRNGAYFEAAEQLSSAYEKISPKNARALAQKAELAYKAGYSYEKAFNDEKAAEWYQRAIDLKYYDENPSVYFRLAGIHRKNGEYDKARENYQEYLKLVPGDEQATNALASLEKAVVLKDNRTRYSVKAEFKINDEGMDMAPTVSDRRGNAIVFASTRKAPVGGGDKDPITGEGYFNIWQVEKDRSGNWTPPILFEGDSINTEHSEGTMVFDGRFRNAFFTRCPMIKKKNLGCEIWVSEKKGRGWGIPVEIDLGQHDSISVGHPCPNEDGSILIFASDLPGGQGGKDLWYTKYERREKSWSAPVNLGPEINTPGDELFPTFALNGDLLFSSTGHQGLGGLDIFRAEKAGDDGVTFKNIQNVGTPLNSDSDDYHLTELDKRNGYFTSNRSGSKGSRNLPDIWSYELPPNIFDLKVIVAEVGSPNRIEGATVEVTGDNGDSFRGVTNAQGSIYWDKKPDGSRYINEEVNYTVKILPLERFHESDDVEQFTTVGLEVDQNFIIEMTLLPKTPIVLPEVRYALGSAELQIIEGEINSKDSLNYVFRLLEEYPGMVLKLVSHTDARGSAKANESLAQRRAQSCVDYLVNEKGVNPARLQAVGKGENQPRTVYKVGEEYYVNKPLNLEFESIELTEKYINQFKKSNPELFEKLHQFNRRTEAEVIRMDFTAEVKTEEKPEEKPE
ncbi:MAG: OmpA family protein [Brumimicrobium sp.]|nr:OmpA family protein [Brumimicrobium sp.]